MVHCICNYLISILLTFRKHINQGGLLHARFFFFAQNLKTIAPTYNRKGEINRSGHFNDEGGRGFLKKFGFLESKKNIHGYFFLYGYGYKVVNIFVPQRQFC